MLARGGLAIALCAGLALASVRCFQDLVVDPSQPTYAFSITPDSADVAIGDTVAPYRGTLTADGEPLGFRLGVVVTAGQDVIRVDSAGRIVALKRGVARLTVRPLISAFTSDTLQRHVTLRAIVPRLGVVASPSVDTLTSLGDTLVLRAAALTRAGDTIPGVPIVWRRVSGDTVAALLDSASGRIRAERNGEAEFVAVVDTATVRRRVVVRQVPTAVIVPDSARLIALGQTASLASSVRDRRGNAVAGQAVTWTSLEAGVASVSAVGIVTAVANGTARIEARLGVLSDTTRLTVAQVARGLRRVSGDAQTGQVATALTAPFVVEVTDSLGAVVARAGEVVRFVVTSGGGKFSALESIDVPSVASGRASATLTLPTIAAAQSVSARLPASPSSLVAFAATATPAPARTLALVSGNDQSGTVGSALAAPFVVAVRDTFGNAIAGRSVTFKVTRGGGKLAGQDSVVVATNAQGQASATLTLGTVADTNRVTATSAGLVGSPVTLSAVAVPAPARTLALVSGNDQSGTVGSALAAPFVVAVRDTFGNAVSGRQVWFKVTRGAGKVAGLDSVAVVTNAQGQASATLTLGTAVDTNRVTATSAGLVGSPVTFSAVAAARAAKKLAFTVQPTNAVAGVAISPAIVVAVQDTFGNTVTTSTAGVTLALATNPCSGVLRGTVTANAIAGVATFSAVSVVRRCVGYTVSASSTGLAAATSNPFTVNHAPALMLVALSGSGQTGQAGSQLAAPFVVSARDSVGNGVDSVPVAFRIATGGGKIGGADSVSVRTDSTGNASVMLTLASVAGANSVTAAVAGLTGSPLTFAATGLHGPARSLALVSGNAQSGVVGTALAAPFVVVARDSLGIGVDSVSVTFAVTAGGGALGGQASSTVLTDATGRAGATLTLGAAAGTNTVSASATGLAGSPVTFISTANTAVTTTVSVVVTPAGDTLAGVGASRTLAAQARNGAGTALTGKTFTWASLNPNVATVGASSGLVTAVASGQVTIAATTDGVTGYALLTVSVPSAPVVSNWETQSVSAKLSDVWGTSMTEAWAVGESGTILRYDGTSWTAQASGTTSFLYGVWGTGSNDVYAVGVGGSILHYDGTTWTAQASGVTATLRHVWGASPRDVYAVGDGGTIVHYNGTLWAAQASGTTSTLHGIWGSSSTDILAVGGPPGTIVHSDGSTWNVQPAFTYGGAFGGTHFAVWGLSRNRLFLASSQQNVYTSTSGYADLNGSYSGWGSPGDFRAIWGASETWTMIAAANTQTGGGGDLRNVCWPGCNTTNPVVGPAFNMKGAWGSSSGLVIAVGEAVAGGGTIVRGTLAASSATVRSVVVTPRGATIAGVGATQTLVAQARDVSGNAIAGKTITWTSLNPNVATVDASSGVVTAVSSGQVTVSATADGVTGYALVTVLQPAVAPVAAWDTVASGTTQHLQGVWGASASDVYAVGGAGTILHYDGSSWAPITSPTTTYLFGIWGTSRNDLFVVGNGGLILHYNGTAWSTMTSGSTQLLRAVWGSSPVDVYAGGDGGLYQYDGTSWTRVIDGIGFNAVWGSSATDVFAGGGGGAIFHFDGATWTRAPQSTLNGIDALWGTSPVNVYATAYGGTILRYDGATWSLMTSGTGYHPYAVGGTSASDVYTVGEQREILRYDGTTWRQAFVGGPGTLLGVWGTATSHVWAVGETGAIRRGLRIHSVAITPSSVTLAAPGATAQLTAQARAPDGSAIGGRAFTWTSRNPAVATVSATGLVTAVAGGQIRIVATTGGVSDSVLVTVGQTVRSMVITPAGASIATAGGTQAFAAVARDSLGNVIAGRTLSWGSLNPNVATVNATTGVVTAVSSGQVAISATADGITAYATVTVTVPGATAVNLWRPVNTGTTEIFFGIGGSSASNIHAPGNLGNFQRFNGTTWAPSGAQSTWYSRGVFCLGDTLCYAAGAVEGAGGTAAVFRHNGSSWTQVFTGGTSYGLNTAWAGSPRCVYAVGSYGNIVRFDGTSWNTMASGVSSHLTAVWGTACDNVWVVGDNGTIRHYDGTSWTGQTSGTSQHLQGIWGSSATHIYAIGYGGVALHSADGQTWSPTAAVPGSPRFNRLWGTSSGDLYGFGEFSGTGSRYDGSSWTTTPTGTSQILFEAWGTPTGSVFAVGYGGTILQGYRGASLTVSPASPTLAVGGTQQLTATARDASSSVVSGVGFTWTSSNPSVATVSGSGLVTAVATGTATITATAPGGASGTAIVTVGTLGGADGFTWVKSASNPVVVRAAGTPYSNAVIVDEVRYENGEYRMWASVASADHVSKVGLFASPDGTSWTFQGVVLDLGGVAYGGVDHLAILRDGSTYRMWYSGRGVSGLPTNRHAVGYATSPDGVTWANAGMVFDLPGTELDVTSVVLENGTYKMWFGAANYATADSTWIGYATSPDGTNWTYVGPVLSRGAAGALDRYMLTVTEVTKVGSTYRMWYGAAERMTPPEGGRLFYATSSDGVTWTKRGVALSGSSATYEDRMVGSPGALLLGNPTRFWYGSAGFATDWSVTYATAIVQPPLPAVASVVVTPGGASISGAGNTQAFRAEARDANGNVILDRTFTWSSLNPAVATVSAATGVVTAVASGQVTIAATVEGVKGYGLLTVAIPGAIPASSWSQMASGLSTEWALGLWGTSSSDVFAVGQQGRILRYNGTAWTPMTSGTTVEMWRVWGTSNADVFAVGGGSTILHFDGATWSAMPNGAGTGLRDVWGTSSKDVFAVGGNGTILHYDGATWSGMTSGTVQGVNAVWGTSASDVYAVGDNGTLLHFDGAMWSAVSGVTAEHLAGIWGTSSSNVYAVGGGGTVARYDGATWTSTATGTSQILLGVYGSSSSDVYAVDWSGAILRYNGTSWSAVSAGTSALHHVWGTSAGAMYAVGANGTILQGLRVPVVAAVGVTPSASTLRALGATAQLSAEARDGSGGVIAGRTFTWTSSDSSKVRVSATGLVTAVANGAVTITATAPGGASGTATVTVSEVRFQSIAAGYRHSCALSDGAAYCWGDNAKGQLGNASRTSSLVPAPVAGSIRFTALSLGGDYSCGVTADSTAYCWGGNSEGQIGDGTVDDRLEPTAVAGGRRFGLIDAGRAHTCAIERGAGAYCWGANLSGQLGDSTQVGRLVPTAVKGGLAPTLVAASWDKTCALDSGGLAYCWGDGNWGGLGYVGGQAAVTMPRQVDGGRAFSSVTTGGFSFHCALTSAGAAYCWGQNNAGQLGIGNADYMQSPTRVSGTQTWTAIANGGSFYGGDGYMGYPAGHTCGLAEAAALYCWGVNGKGQGGYGTTTRAEPALVRNALPYTRLAAGDAHTCMLTEDGRAYCMGWNAFGQIGDGTTSDRVDPTRVRTP